MYIYNLVVILVIISITTIILLYLNILTMVY
jgi:hypothetical protein